MTDNALAYRRARDFQSALAALCAKHVLIKPRQLAAQLSSCDLPLRCSGWDGWKGVDAFCSLAGVDHFGRRRIPTPTAGVRSSPV